MDLQYQNKEALFLPVLNIYDGDTIETRFPLPTPLNLVRIRILGIDTPEMPAKSYYETGKLGRADCVHEAELALAAREHLREFIREYDNVIIVDNFKWDKYGGRVDGDVFVGQDGICFDVKEEMIVNSFAVPYSGGKKIHKWCDICS